MQRMSGRKRRSTPRRGWRGRRWRCGFSPRRVETTPHSPFGHLLPQGEKAITEASVGLLPLWEKVGEARMKGSLQGKQNGSTERQGYASKARPDGVGEFSDGGGIAHQVAGVQRGADRHHRRRERRAVARTAEWRRRQAGDGGGP